MKAEKVHAIVLALEALRLEVRSLGHAADPAVQKEADQHASWSRALCRQELERESPERVR